MRADAQLYKPFRTYFAMHVLESGIRIEAKAIELENKYIVEYDSIKAGHNDLKGNPGTLQEMVVFYIGADCWVQTKVRNSLQLPYKLSSIP
jgi:hypothetical protein